MNKLLFQFSSQAIGIVTTLGLHDKIVYTLRPEDKTGCHDNTQNGAHLQWLLSWEMPWLLHISIILYVLIMASCGCPQD